MGVYIKGMDMPKGCSRCTLLYRGSDERYHCPFNSSCVWLDFDDIPDYIIDNDCPLVSVPTLHGRLVDIDAEVEKHDCVPILGEHLKLMAKHMTTVIEGEE